MSRRTTLSRFRRLSPADRSALLEACWTLGVTRIAVKVVPFRRIARTLESQAHDARVLTPKQEIEARRIGWAVSAVSRTRLLRAVCLGQAIAAHAMLKRRNIPSTVHLGVRNAATATTHPAAETQRGSLTAHAWVTAGELFVTGGAGHENFTEVSRIGSNAQDVPL